MSRADRIGVGDLVAMVRGHECVMNVYGGIPFTVTSIDITHDPDDCFWCYRCRFTMPAEGIAFVYGLKDEPIPMTWLRKFPPLALPRIIEKETTEQV